MSIDLRDIGEAIVLLGAAVGALIYLGKWPFNKVKEKRMKHKEAQILIFDEIPKLAERLEWIASELKPNHGTSLRDSINRIESKMNRSHSMLMANMRLSGDAMFQVNGNGEMEWCNQAFLELVERDTTELLGGQWVQIINESEREHVRTQVEDAVRYKTEMTLYFNITTANEHYPGGMIPIECRAQPVLNAENILCGYIGTFVDITHNSQE